MSKYLYLLSKHRSAVMGFAILWIMFFHYPVQTNCAILDTIKNFGYSGVDIFLFLSGFGLYFSLSKKSISLKQYYKKRFIRILPEFWIYLLLIFLISKDYSLKGIWELLCCATTLGYWISLIPYKLWFVSCILLFYAIFPFYFYTFKKYGTKATISAISIGLFLIVLYALIMVICFNNKNEGGLIVLTVSRIPIFFIGSYIGHLAKDGCRIQFSYMGKAFILSAFAIGVLSLLIFSHYLPNYLWTCSLFFLPNMIITPILCAILAILFEWLPRMITLLFTKTGIISFELYLTHDFFYSSEKTIENIYGVPFSVLIIICCSFFFALLLNQFNRLFLQKVIMK